MTSLSLSRHSRLAQRKKRARDSEAADSLLQLSKHPRITADRDGDSSGNGDDCSGANSASPSIDKRARDSEAADSLLELSKHPRITADRDGDSSNSNDCSGADSASPSADNDAHVSQLQEELATVKCEKSKLEMEKKELELKAEELRSRVAQLEAENSQVAIANSQLVVQCHHLSESLNQSLTTLQASKFGVNLILNNDEKTSFYTGLATYDLFLSLYNMLKPFHTGVANINHFFATLLYLRLRTPMVDLGTRLQKESKSTVSRMFHSWIETMYHNLRPLVAWPDTETLRRNLPNAFKKHFSDVKCIIDCFEIFTERPVGFQARASTYSNYKKHNMVKVLIAIAPTGAITFISKAWTRRVSDKVITQKCRILDHIEYGDVVLADRGFNIQDDLALIGARLEIPSFTRGKTQLSRAKVEKSRRLARVRIHVERVIGQLRKKYKILQQKLPMTLIKRPSDRDAATIDKILLVTAALTNLSQSVV